MWLCGWREGAVALSLTVEYYIGIVLISSYINTCCFRFFCIVPHKLHAVQMLLDRFLSGLIVDELSLCVCVLVSMFVCISSFSLQTIQVIWCWWIRRLLLWMSASTGTAAVQLIECLVNKLFVYNCVVLYFRHGVAEKGWTAMKNTSSVYQVSLTVNDYFHCVTLTLSLRLKSCTFVWIDISIFL